MAGFRHPGAPGTRQGGEFFSALASGLTAYGKGHDTTRILRDEYWVHVSYLWIYEFPWFLPPTLTILDLYRLFRPYFSSFLALRIEGEVTTTNKEHVADLLAVAKKARSD